MNKPEFVYVVYISSTPQAVWDALTDPEFTARYWGGRRIQSSWQPGAPVRHLRSDGRADWEGEVLAADPPRLLSYTFHMNISDAHARDHPSRVRFEVEPVGEMVRLRLTHEHAEPGTATHETTSHGWPAILSSLKSLLETGEPLPFQGLGFAPGEQAPGRR